MKQWKMPRGWRGESYRHYLASKGVRTVVPRGYFASSQELKQKQMEMKLRHKGLEPYDISPEEQQAVLGGFGEQVREELLAQQNELLQQQVQAQAALLKKQEARQKILEKVARSAKRLRAEEVRRLENEELFSADEEGNPVHYRRLFHVVSEEEAESLSRITGLPTRIVPDEEGYGVYVAVGVDGGEE